MGQIKNYLKALLPKRLVETLIFYKNYNNPKGGIYKYLDYRVVQQLNKYPPFQVGETTFLGKKVKFSHAPSLIHSLEEIFCDQIYSFIATGQQPYILDCGSNIGISVIFFKKRYPNAKIIAFEPDGEIFELLQGNIKSFGFENVELINKAVWNKTEEVYFYHEGALAGSLTTDYSYKNTKTKVLAVDLLSYLKEPIDFLKIDIEGAEFTVLEHIKSHLFHVKNLFIEYHSDKRINQELHHLLTIISEAGFRYYLKEAAILSENPFVERAFFTYDLQVNIFCYRP